MGALSVTSSGIGLQGCKALLLFTSHDVYCYEFSLYLIFRYITYELNDRKEDKTYMNVIKYGKVGTKM